jgi:DNA polymerase-1
VIYQDLIAPITGWQLPWFLDKPDPGHYLSAPYLVLDLETTNLDKGSPVRRENRVVCASWYYKGEGRIQFEEGDEFHLPRLRAAIELVLSQRGFLVGHNIKFDLQWLARGGLDLHRVLCYDTMIGEYVLAGNRKWPLGLDAVSKRYGCVGKASLVDTLLKAGVCPSEMPPDYVKARVIRDVKDTLKVFRKQRQALAKRRQLPVQLTRCLLTPVLADMEMQGLCLNKDRVYQEYDRAKAEYEALLREFNEITGGANPRSPKQMADLIYGLPEQGGLGFKELKKYGKLDRNKPSKAFPLGVPKTDDATLGKLKATNAKQRKFLELRAKIGPVGAALSKTLEFFKRIVDEREGVFYGQYNQTIAATHRLTSSSRRVTFSDGVSKGVQLQNLPNEFKDLIQARRPGFLVGDHDGSQLEFRVAAFLGNDKQAKWNIRNDVDQHKFSASQMLRKPVSEVTKEERRLAKAETFKPLYGGSRGTEAQERYYAAFRETFADLARTQKDWTYEVLETQKLRMPWGMEWHFPGTRMRDDGYIDNTPSIYNYPVQNLATGEMIPVAVTYLWHRMHEHAMQSALVNTVHDSVVGEVAPGEEELWMALGLQCFTMDVYHYLREVYGLEFDVPLGVGSGIASRWEAPGGTERELNVEPDGIVWEKGTREPVDTGNFPG